MMPNKRKTHNTIVKNKEDSMKLYSNQIVPMHLIKNITPMKKVFSLAVIAFITALFSLVTTDTKAQCDKVTKGHHVLLVSQTDTFEGKGGELWLVGIKSSAETTFPCNFKWRKNNKEGEIISSGTIESPITSPPIKNEIGKINNLATGVYILITYDSSTPCKRTEKTFEIR